MSGYKTCEDWLAKQFVSDFEGIQVSHVYAAWNYQQARITELEIRLAAEKESVGGCAVVVAKQKDRITLLEAAILEHKAGTKMRAGSLWSATPEDAALWALLQEQEK